MQASSSTTVTETIAPEVTPVLRLRQQPSAEAAEGGRPPPRVTWTEDTVEINEYSGKKKSNICCIFHPSTPMHQLIDSDTDSSSSSSSSSDSSDSSDEDDGPKYATQLIVHLLPTRLQAVPRTRVTPSCPCTAAAAAAAAAAGGSNPQAGKGLGRQAGPQRLIEKRPPSAASQLPLLR